MKLDRARRLALLLALTLAPAGVAHAQQYPYTEASFAEVDGEDAPPPPPKEEGAAEPAPPAPEAEAGPPDGTQPALAPSAMPQPEPWQSDAGPALGCPSNCMPMMQQPICDGCVGEDMLCAQDYGAPDGCCQTGCCNGCGNDSCGADGQAGCGLGCCDCCLPEYIYFRADVIFMTRSRSLGQPIAALGAGGPIILSTRNLGFRWEPVERLLLGVPVDDNMAVELSYMGLQTWQSRNAALATVTNGVPGVVTTLFSPFSNFGAGAATAADGALNATINYNSTLHNMEFNFVSCLRANTVFPGRLDLVHGVRWIEVLERFDYNTLNAVGAFTSLSSVNTFNNMVGYQVGCRWEAAVRPRWHVALEPKVGLYNNFTAQRTSIQLGNVLTETARRSEIGFATDCTFTLSYDVAPWCSMRLGYTAMYLGGVALAPQNFAPQPVPFGAVPRVPLVNVAGSILYQGASIGFEARF